MVCLPGVGIVLIEHSFPGSQSVKEGLVICSVRADIPHELHRLRRDATQDENMIGEEAWFRGRLRLPRTDDTSQVSQSLSLREPECPSPQPKLEARGCRDVEDSLAVSKVTGHSLVLQMLPVRKRKRSAPSIEARAVKLSCSTGQVSPCGP